MPMQKRLWWTKQGQSLIQKLCEERIQIKEIYVLLPLFELLSFQSTVLPVFEVLTFFVWTVKQHQQNVSPCIQFGWTYFVWIMKWSWEHPGRSLQTTVNPSLFQGIIHYLVCFKKKFACWLLKSLSMRKNVELNIHVKWLQCLFLCVYNPAIPWAKGSMLEAKLHCRKKLAEVYLITPQCQL